MSKLPIFEHFLSVGNLKPKLKRFFKPKLKAKFSIELGPSDALLQAGFKFYEGYPLPDHKNIEEYVDHIINMPLQDIPEVFGLHSNADISYQVLCRRIDFNVRF